MTRISVPGNEGGFVLLDALICLFTTALMLLFLSCAVSGVLRSSLRAFDLGMDLINKRNSNAALFAERTAYDER
jgi:hypothetical protein